MDTHLAKQFVVLVIQCLLFCLLYVIGFLYEVFGLFRYRIEYASYSFTHARLAELAISLANDCSNLTNIPCSLQIEIDIYFFRSKFLLLYYLSIIIGITYTWHRTVRFSYCIYTFFVLANIIFRTDLFFYFDWIVGFTSIVCLPSIYIFAFLEALMPHNSHDPLYTLCERIVSLNQLDECLLTGHSKHACFYRWATKMKKQWNIEEEKLIITFIVGIFTNIVVTISIFVCRSYPSGKGILL